MHVAAAAAAVDRSPFDIGVLWLLLLFSLLCDAWAAAYICPPTGNARCICKCEGVDGKIRSVLARDVSLCDCMMHAVYITLASMGKVEMQITKLAFCWVTI